MDNLVATRLTQIKGPAQDLLDLTVTKGVWVKVQHTRARAPLRYDVHVTAAAVAAWSTRCKRGRGAGPGARHMWLRTRVLLSTCRVQAAIQARRARRHVAEPLAE